MNTLNKLNEIFRVVFADEEINIQPEMTANDVDGWDSLSHVNLILAVEKDFNIKFGQKELLNLQNVGDLLKMIEDKIS
jgi:acyl carrier protein